jgi:hypothetical protein
MDKRPHAPDCFCYKCEAEQFSAARAAKEKADDRLALTACSPSSIVALVRRYNRWRKGDDTLEMENPKAIGEALDAICDITENLERERNALKAAGVEIIEAARRSMPRKHGTIERNAKLFISENK